LKSAAEKEEELWWYLSAIKIPKCQQVKEMNKLFELPGPQNFCNLFGRPYDEVHVRPNGKARRNKLLH